MPDVTPADHHADEAVALMALAGEMRDELMLASLLRAVAHATLAVFLELRAQGR